MTGPVWFEKEQRTSETSALVKRARRRVLQGTLNWHKDCRHSPQAELEVELPRGRTGMWWRVSLLITK